MTRSLPGIFATLPRVISWTRTGRLSLSPRKRAERGTTNHATRTYCRPLAVCVCICRAGFSSKTETYGNYRDQERFAAKQIALDYFPHLVHDGIGLRSPWQGGDCFT